MSELFTKPIHDWTSWGAVYQDANAFLPLVRAIYRHEGLPLPEHLGRLTPGTNAVFRCDDTVIKLYAPPASGLESERDYDVERAMLPYLEGLGIRTSEMIASGIMEDRYRFCYLIMRYVDGVDAGDVLPGMPVGERTRFARDMWRTVERMHRPGVDLLPPLDVIRRAVENPRLSALPASLAESMRARAAIQTWQQAVVVHGDLTGENVLIDRADRPVIIDCADACMAPACYELPPLVFELFRADRTMVRAYAGDIPRADFVESLLDGLSLHDFGADLLIDYAKRAGVSLECFHSLEDFGAHCLRIWQ